MSEETWKAIAGYEGLYEVSSLGQVRSLPRVMYRKTDGRKHTVALRILKPSLMQVGYFRVTLSKNGAQEQFCIHRLVAEAFIPNDECLPEVNHKDLCYTNNVVDNLEWVTHCRNILHARDGGRLHGYTNPKQRVKLTPENVADIRAAVARREKHESIGNRHGVSRRLVGMIGRGDRWNPEFEARAVP